MTATLLATTVATLSACSSGSSPTDAPTPAAVGASFLGTASSPAAANASVAAGAATNGPAPTAAVASRIPGSSPAPVIPAASANHGTGQGVSVLGLETKPGCDPTLFVNRASVVGGALMTYLFSPEAKGALSGSGTAHAVAVLHAGQAVRFGAAQLTAARQALAACPKVTTALVTAIDAEIVRLRAAGAVFRTNKVPSTSAVGGLRTGQAATVAEAKKVKIVLVDVVPSAVQISSS